MKATVLLFFSIFRLSAMSQQCMVAVSPGNFTIIRNQVSGASTAAVALQKGREAAQNNCFTSYQAKEILALYFQDLQKIEIAKLIYPNVIDKADFSIVYEIFTNAPALASLAKFVEEYNNRPQTGEPMGLEKKEVIFPDFEKYKGYKWVNQSPPGNNAFARFLDAIIHPDPAVAFRNALQTDPSGYFTTAQVMEIALLFREESMRLKILQHYAPQMLDIFNYPYAFQLLSTFQNKNRYQQTIDPLLRTAGTENPPNKGPVGCGKPVSSAEILLIKNNLEKINLSAARVKQYKAVVKNKCFTAAQVKMLVLLFNNSDRLDLLRYTYDFCSDVQNYYALSEVLELSRDSESFSNFLLEK